MPVDTFLKESHDLIERAKSDTHEDTAVGNNCIIHCQPNGAKLVKWLRHEGICVIAARKERARVLLGRSTLNHISFLLALVNYTP